MLAMIISAVTPYLCGVTLGGVLALHGVTPAEAASAGLEMARGIAIVRVVR